MFEDARLDLAGLDADAVELELKIRTAEELDLAVRQIPREVPRAVYRGVGAAPDLVRGPEGVGEEAPGSEVAPVEVAAPDPLAADEQFAHRADRQASEPGREDVARDVAERLPNAAIAARRCVGRGTLSPR